MRHLLATSILSFLLVAPFQAFAAPEVITTCSSFTNSVRIGDTGSRSSQAQSFTPATSGTISSVQVGISTKDGSPTDGLILEISTDSSGHPGTLLTSLTVSQASLSTTDSYNTFIFGSPASVSASSLYWLNIKRGGAINGTNYNNTDVQRPGGYSGGSLVAFNGVTWDADPGSGDECIIVTVDPLSSGVVPAPPRPFWW